MEEQVIRKENKAVSYLKALPKRYFITAFSGMAQGLFVTLIAGTILAQIAGWIGNNYVGNTLLYIANIAKSLMGAGIGVGIAHALGKNKLLIFSDLSAIMIADPDLTKRKNEVTMMTIGEKIKELRKKNDLEFKGILYNAMLKRRRKRKRRKRQ